MLSDAILADVFRQISDPQVTCLSNHFAPTSSFGSGGVVLSVGGTCSTLHDAHHTLRGVPAPATGHQAPSGTARTTHVTAGAPISADSSAADTSPFTGLFLLFPFFRAFFFFLYSLFRNNRLLSHTFFLFLLFFLQLLSTFINFYQLFQLFQLFNNFTGTQRRARCAGGPAATSRWAAGPRCSRSRANAAAAAPHGGTH